MKITKSGFYCLKEMNGDIHSIEIEDNLNVSLFDHEGTSINVSIGAHSKVHFFGVIDGGDIKSEKNFIQNKENSELQLRYLLLSEYGNKIDTKIYSELSSNNSLSHVQILSIVGEGGDIDLDGVIKIEKGIQGVNGHLEEENIFLGEKGKVKGIPTLLVRSDDVKASHACKMEKISDEKLFYLRSRGVGKEGALNMMIDSYITKLFSGLEGINKEFFDDFLENILQKIK